MIAQDIRTRRGKPARATRSGTRVLHCRNSRHQHRHRHRLPVPALWLLCFLLSSSARTMVNVGLHVAAAGPAATAAAARGDPKNDTDHTDATDANAATATGSADDCVHGGASASTGGGGGGGNGRPQKTKPKSRPEEGKWCNLDVVTFDDGDNDNDNDNDNDSRRKKSKSQRSASAIRTLWRRVARGVQKVLARVDNSANSDDDVLIEELLTFYPPPVATTEQSKWIRGVPPSPSNAAGTIDTASGTPNNRTTSSRLTLDDLMRWDFDPLSYPSEDLVPALSLALSYFDLPSKLGLDLATIDNFARAVMDHHGTPDAVPYHNWHHGVSCLHVAFCLLTLGGASAYYPSDDGVEIFALLVAAIVHDVDHPGHNNDLENKRGSDLAQRYDHRAVLEANSVDVTFGRILPECGPECDIFGAFGDSASSTSEQGAATGPSYGRETVVEMVRDMVLATDPAGHGDMVKTILAGATASASGGTYWDRADPSSRSLLSRLIIHAADISNPASPDFAVARDWCQRISEEFRRQARAERSEGLAVTAFMDGLADEYEVARQQLGFYEYMALPLYRVISLTLPEAAVLEGWARANLERFRRIVAAVDEWREEKETDRTHEEEQGKQGAERSPGNIEL